MFKLAIIKFVMAIVVAIACFVMIPRYYFGTPDLNDIKKCIESGKYPIRYVHKYVDQLDSNRDYSLMTNLIATLESYMGTTYEPAIWISLRYAYIVKIHLDLENDVNTDYSKDMARIDSMNDKYLRSIEHNKIEAQQQVNKMGELVEKSIAKKKRLLTS
jgi:hypothetical protein